MKKFINFNLGVKRHVEKPEIIRNGLRLARAEAYLLNVSLNSSHPAHKALFDDSFEFCICAKSPRRDGYFGIRMKAIDFIGLGDVGFKPLPEISPEGCLYRYHYPMRSGRVFELGNEYECGKVYLMSTVAPDPDKRRVTELPDATLDCLDNQKLINVMLEHYPRTNEGFAMPLVGLYAIKLSAMHNRHYTVEAAVDEIYALGLISEPDFSQDSLPSIQLSNEIWTPTPPQCIDIIVVKEMESNRTA